MKNKEEADVKLSRELLQMSGLPEGLDCQLSVEDGQLRLGPVIGVFVSKSSIRKLENQQAKMRTMELIYANQEAKTILYFFSSQDVNHAQKKIFGTYFNDQTQRWEKNIFPYPDVLYDRGSGHPTKLSFMKTTRKKLESTPSIKKLNATHYFNKWDLHQRLSPFKKIKKHLPRTLLYQHPLDFKKMLRKNRILYLKRNISSNGRKVMRIVQSPPWYKYRYYTNQLVQGKMNSRRELMNKLKHFFPDQDVIIQRAVNGLRVNRRLTDFRATVQRNGHNEVEITAIAARIAQNRSPITSTRAGALCYRFDDFCHIFLDLTDEQTEQLQRKVKQFLLDVYESLETSYGTFAEVGIDFALDKKGKLWLIECNAKPAKSTLYRAFTEETFGKAFLNLLEYAKYLTGFQSA